MSLINHTFNLGSEWVTPWSCMQAVSIQHSEFGVDWRIALAFDETTNIHGKSTTEGED